MEFIDFFKIAENWESRRQGLKIESSYFHGTENITKINTTQNAINPNNINKKSLAISFDIDFKIPQNVDFSNSRTIIKDFEVKNITVDNENCYKITKTDGNYYKIHIV